MAESLKLRIAKKAYVFDIRRKFAYRQYYAPKKKEAPEFSGAGIGRLISGLGGAKKKKEEPGAAAPAPVLKSAAQGAKSTIKAVGIMLLAVALLLAVAWVYIAGTPPEQQRAPASAGAYFDIAVSQPEVLNLGDQDDLQYAIRNVVSYATANITGMELKVGVFADRPPSQVFVLDYAREGADHYGEFRAALKEELERRGLPVTDIDIEQLATVPPGATVIIPTGFVPLPLVSQQYSMPYAEIVERGATIVYIGNAWNTVALTPDRETVTVPGADPFGLSFSSRVRPVSTLNFSLFDALYTVEGRGGRVIGSGSVYGSVSYLKMGQGYLLFVPQTIDGGWRQNATATGGTAAGNDIARLVSEAPWLKPVLVNSANVTMPENGSIAEGEAEIFTLPVKSPQSYVRIVANLLDIGGGVHGANIVLDAEKTRNSDIYMSAIGNTVAPTSITDQKVRMLFVLREGSSKRARVLLQTLYRGWLNKTDEIESGTTALDSLKSYDYDTESLTDGDYVLKLADLDGNAYAQAILRVKEIRIEPGKLDWVNGRFQFELRGPNGETVAGKRVTVSLGGKDVQEFDSAGVMSYNVSQSNIPEAGKYHTFTFSVGKAVKRLEILSPKRSKPFWENPLVIVFGLVSVLIAAAGTYFAKPERQSYGLDVPDFPPMSQIKIPVTRATAIEIFEQVNRDYSWQRMPLRLKEIKDGFRKLTYNGKPILIGDYNLERLLESLEREGHVRSSRGFYGLARWEKETGHTMFYMSMYRQMRDVFVTNAVRFTKLGASPDYDVLVDIRKGGVYVQIYENEGAIARALSTAKAGPTIIVFADEYRLEEFGSLLDSTNDAAVALKVYIDNGVVTATAIEKLEKLVRDLRGS